LEVAKESPKVHRVYSFEGLVIMDNSSDQMSSELDWVEADIITIHGIREGRLRGNQVINPSLLRGLLSLLLLLLLQRLDLMDSPEVVVNA
jgi:hypothetical protein